MNEEGLVFADGFDSCILGVMVVDEVARVVYDKYAMVNCMRLAEIDLSFEDAVEFLEFNVWHSYVGPATPIYLYTMDGQGKERREEAIEYYYDMLDME